MIYGPEGSTVTFSRSARLSLTNLMRTSKGMGLASSLTTKTSVRQLFSRAFSTRCRWPRVKGSAFMTTADRGKVLGPDGEAGPPRLFAVSFIQPPRPSLRFSRRLSLPSIRTASAKPQPVKKGAALHLV